MRVSEESPAGTAPSVLLIEEYDALAAAITSALRKFAPRHRTRVVESLSEAEEAAAAAAPQLFIIDFDPPLPHAIEFLNRMQTAYPDARVLVIASGTSAEFAAGRWGPNAVQFVEKPFELPDFGAAVQALLGPWTEASSGDSRGTLRDLNLRDLVPLECVSGAAAVLQVEAGGDRKGEIHFLEGHICHASVAGLDGIAALYEMMRWKSTSGRESERPADAPRTIQGPWLPLFIDALRRAKPRDEDRPPPRRPVPAEVELKSAAPVPTRNGKKIVVIDDTEMLLIFVEDSLSLADPSLQIVTAFTGGEGVRRAEVIVPDLVLLDYSLPDLCGDKVCERLLQNKTTANIPVVMMSGHVPEMMATAERYPNVVATIAKPFVSEALIQLVNETLAKGPLSFVSKIETIPILALVDQPLSVVVSEVKPARLGNGKKPAVRKSSLPNGGPREVREKPILPPAPTIAPSVVSAPPEAIEIVEPIPMAAPPAPSPPPAARDIRPAEPTLLERPPSFSTARPAKLAGPNGGAVVLGLGMEVISVQFTPRFQIGTIRARPSGSTLSLTQLLTPALAEDPWGAGFELGPVELDAQGRLSVMRVRPTRRPVDSIRTHNGFAINDVELLDEAACIQFTAGTSVPMTMQLVAVFNVTEVELSDRFEVSQLILQPQSTRVRVTLDPQARGTAGTDFETAGLRLDASGRIAEFLLCSIQSDQSERRVHVA